MRIAYQKSFWKFVGILALVSIVIGIVGIPCCDFVVPAFLAFRG